MFIIDRHCKHKIQSATKYNFIYLFFIYVHQVSSQLELWANELERNQNEVITTLSEAESRLSRHNESVAQMQAAVYQALEQGEQLAQVIC